MTTVVNAGSYGRFLEIRHNLRRKKLHRIKASIFLEVILAIENLEEKVNPSILRDDFSPRTDPSIFTSITKLVEFFSIEINKPLPAQAQCLVD